MARDDYQWWRDALAGVKGEAHDGHPHPGFYRRRKVKGGPWLPVAIWRDDLGLVQCVVGAEFAPEDADDTWLACALHPVTEADYRHACSTGAWPGDAPATPAAAASNNPPTEAQALPARIEEAVQKARAWLEGRSIVSQADADRCETMVHELAGLAKAADEQRDAEVRPHLEAQRAANARWKPIVDAASSQVRAIKAALAPFLKAREAEKRAAAATAVARGDEVRVDTRATTSGLSGRRVALRTVTRANVTDWEKAALFFANNPELQAVVQKLANKVAAVGGTVPGVEIMKEQVAA